MLSYIIQKLSLRHTRIFKYITGYNILILLKGTVSKERKTFQHYLAHLHMLLWLEYVIPVNPCTCPPKLGFYLETFAFFPRIFILEIHVWQWLTCVRLTLKTSYAMVVSPLTKRVNLWFPRVEEKIKLAQVGFLSLPPPLQS